ncbi:MAG TPA: M1 family aminopeptidase [Noviherbaspirillum sp.]|nr:M1 family aminopeptidase [Noviherbaspirillum sp.]
MRLAPRFFSAFPARILLLPARMLFTALVLTFLCIIAQQSAAAASFSLELQVELDPSTRRFKALADVVPASRDFRFTLHESLEITAASAEGKTVRVVSAGRDGARRDWRIELPVEAKKLRLEYEGTLPAMDRNLDHRDVLRNLPPMASAEGSFLPSGSGWYPQPAPMFSYRVTLSVPSSQRALVAGRMVSENPPSPGGSGRYSASFEFGQPADGIDLMAGPWIVREKMIPRAAGGPLRLRTYFSPELDAMPGLADGYLDDVRRYLELYGEQIGAYPFTEFSVVASPLPTGFGMPTLTYLGAEVLKLPFIRATSLGHEVLHNWWGNGVYVDYAKGNWSEGLTTFMADYAYKERESPDAARQMRLGWLRDFAALPAGAQQSLSAFRSRTHGAEAAVGYGKSAMLFVMLRDAIGEDVFLRGIRAFWEKHRFQRASWSDLRLSFEQACRCSLGNFFEQWINRTGGPEVTIASATATPESAKTRLTLRLQQNAPSYALHLPVELVYPDKSEVRWIDIARKSDAVTLTLDSRPQAVRLDPELRVWRLLQREQLPPILRRWIVAGAPRLVHASQAADVRAAAKALAESLFEAPPQTIQINEASQGNEPVLLVGLHADVNTALARAGLPPRPARLNRGSAQVWAFDRGNGPPVAVISANDAASLRALMRPLPHYGSQSWLMFDGSRALERGVWPTPGRLVAVRDAKN